MLKGLRNLLVSQFDISADEADTRDANCVIPAQAIKARGTTGRYRWRLRRILRFIFHPEVAHPQHTTKSPLNELDLTTRSHLIDITCRTLGPGHKTQDDT